MKLLRIIFLFFVVCWCKYSISQTYDELTNKTWIAIDTKQVGDGWITPVQGVILKFQPDSVVEWNNIETDTTILLTFFIKNDSLYIDDKNMGYIQTLSNNELILYYGEHMLIEFRTVPKGMIEMTSDQITNLLLSNNWKVRKLHKTQRIDFLDFIYIPEYSSLAKVCITHDYGLKWRNSDQEKWVVEVVNSTAYLGLSQGQIMKLYEIEEVSTEKMILQNLSSRNHKSIKFYSESSLDEYQINTIEEIIASNQWKIKRISKRNIGEGVTILADKLLVLDDFLNKKVEFQFDLSDTLSMIKGNKVLQTVPWQLTKDGKFIILGHPRHPDNYYQILEQSTNRLKLGFTIDLKINPESHEYQTFNCVMVLNQ